MSSSNCCFLTCIKVSQEASQVVWYSHLLENFPQFIVIHPVKGFGIVNKAEIDVFLELSSQRSSGYWQFDLWFLSSSKTNLNIWKFSVHVLLKPGLENFEHYFTSVWDECNCVVVWAFFGTAFLRDWNENEPFPGDQWRNNSRKNEGMEPRQKQYTTVAGTGDRSKVWCCKKQYCIGIWNVRSMNQGKLEVVKQETARVNVDNLGISKLKWTGMGEFNSDDHYIYYCGQESLRRNGVAIIVNKRVRNAVLGWNLKNDRMISVHFQGKPLNIMVIQAYAPTSNAEEAEVEWFYEDLQDLQN